MFYKAVFNGSCKGQDIKNILYYRSGLGMDVLGLTLAGTEALAGNLKQEVWPALKNWLTPDYVLETIDVSAINDEFQLVYQMPFRCLWVKPGWRIVCLLVRRSVLTSSSTWNQPVLSTASNLLLVGILRSVLWRRFTLRRTAFSRQKLWRPAGSQTFRQRSPKTLSKCFLSRSCGSRFA